MLGLLSHPTLGLQTALGFENVLNSSANDNLTSICHCNIRFLYYQRFYLMTSQRLIEGFHQADSGKFNNSEHYIVCLKI